MSNTTPIDADLAHEYVDDSDLKKYRTEIPNMADDELNPYQFRLYAHYKRVGTCWETVRTTAAKTRMSVGQVVATREWLRNNGWITVDQHTSGTLRITIVDRWAENMERYTGVHHLNTTFTTRTQRSPGEPKNKPIKKEPIKKSDNTPKLPKEELDAIFNEICEICGLDIQRVRGSEVSKIRKDLIEVGWRSADLVTYRQWRIRKDMPVLGSMHWLQAEMAKTDWRSPLPGTPSATRNAPDTSYLDGSDDE